MNYKITFNRAVKHM